MRLVEAGRLTLEAPVRAYVPDFRVADPAASDQVTVRDLLAHTVGWVGDVFEPEDVSQNDDALAVVTAGMARLPQVAPVGTVFSYSNAGYVLAGRLAEAVAGKPFDALLQELVFAPLGMTHSFANPYDAITHRLAVGHAATPRGLVVLRDWALPRLVTPAGQIITSVRDQVRFAHAQLGHAAEGAEPLLAPKTLARMQAPLGPGGAQGVWDLDGIGASWELRTVGGTRIVQKGGRTDGLEALLLLVPERGFAFVAQTNARGGALLADDAATWALREYLGVTVPPITTTTLPAERLRPYAGRYVSPGDRAFEVRPGDGDLLVQRVPVDDAGPGRPAPPVRMAFYGPDRVVGLEGSDKDARNDFVRRPGGSIGWFRYGGRLHARQD
jgi:CubicO group peptidase (beta-lactamase class C family)